ncbi:MAG: cation:proton antiporter [Fretibacterium sp.]|nr:cation:proton antiporter [Fretibacterium sp.]
MFEQLHALLIENGSTASVGIITIAIMLLCGFALTRLTKLLRLPNVTAYIVTGILIGPYCLDLVPGIVVGNTGFLPDIALAFIAFSTGQFFRLAALRGNGLRVLVITVLEACVASLFVFIAAYGFLGMDLAFSAVLAALASATAPASTMMTIRQTGARGDFVNTLLQVVALDDVVGLLAYSIAISIALVSTASGVGFDPKNVISPILINLGSLVLGALLGVLLKLLLPERRSTDNRLIISVAVLFGFCGICELIGVSPLLGCMSMATVYINITGDDKLFKQLNYFSPPFLLLFFVRSGVGFDLGLLLSPQEAGTSFLTLGVVYFLIRIAGKYAGAFLGCALTHKAHSVRNYLGLALIPQAGVAIGLAELGARTLGGDMGSALRTVILASSVLYELIGPGCAKLSLVLSRSIPTGAEEEPVQEAVSAHDEEKHAVNLLIERIKEIQAELPKHAMGPAYEAAPAQEGRNLLVSMRRRFHSNNIK